MDKFVPIGKGSLRVRGEYVFGLYILEGKEVELFRVPQQMLANDSSLVIRDALLDVVRLMVSDIIFEATGIRPSWPGNPVKAPDNEREKKG